jgi:hypothetical protein
MINFTQRLLYGIVLLLAVMLPFALLRPIVIIGPIDLNNIELLIGLSLLVGAVHVVFVGGWRVFRPLMPALILLGGFIGAALLSAVLAPEHNVSALRFSIRFIIGVYLLVLTIYTARDRQRIAGILWALVIGAGASALLGIGEALPIPEIDRALLLFHDAPSMVGSTLRVSATFQYTTIASMYFEMAVPAAVALTAYTQQRYAKFLALGIAIVCTVVVVLTLTRSGMVALFLTSLLMAVVYRQKSVLLPAATVMATMVITFGALLVLDDTFRVRLTTEDDTHWFNAVYEVPGSMQLTAGETTPVTISVQNSGIMAWNTDGKNPFKLAYYWYDVEKVGVINQAHSEVGLPHDVAPGETVNITADVSANLPPGHYRLMWGMLQSNITWFRVKGVKDAYTEVEVLPAVTTFRPLNTRPTAPGDDMKQDGAVAVSRSLLWRVALDMWRERPLLGYGPDNFRLRYGTYLGFEQWYVGNHANNLYLELLATTGILGFVTFFGFLAFLGIHLWRSIRTSNLLAAGMGGILLVFLMHGFFDYFLPWLPTLGMFWITCGLVLAIQKPRTQEGVKGDAHDIGDHNAG